MRAVIQRVTSASVSVDGEVISSVGRGLCVLVGIAREDEPANADWLARKILNLRLFESAEGKKWDRSVKDEALEILCVSQFTLQCTLKGNKLDFRTAMAPDSSPAFYAAFLEKLRNLYHPDKIKDGRFGAIMAVSLTNDGPVTINLDSTKPNKDTSASLKSLE